MPYEIEGNWKAGWALQLHTIKSVMLENGSFENTYSPTGHALNRLKYHNETQYITQLANELVEFMTTRYVTPLGSSFTLRQFMPPTPCFS